VAGVSWERTVFRFMGDPMRASTLELVLPGGVAVDRIRFIDALRWLVGVRPGEALTKLVMGQPDVSRSVRAADEPGGVPSCPCPWMSVPRHEYGNTC
jgi:hypothetical protein